MKNTTTTQNQEATMKEKMIKIYGNNKGEIIEITQTEYDARAARLAERVAAVAAGPAPVMLSQDRYRNEETIGGTKQSDTVEISAYDSYEQ